jgi:hypothetical protein
MEETTTVTIPVAKAFECVRCHYTSSRKGDLIKHLNRKKTCPATFCNKDAKTVIQDLKLRKGIDDLRIACPWCDKHFKTHQSIYQHKKRCKKNEQNIAVENKDVVIVQENDNELVTNVAEATQNDPAVSGGSNAIVPRKKFGREEVAHIHDNHGLLVQLIRRRDRGVLDYLQLRFMNPEHPADNTVRVSNIKMSFIQIFDGTAWRLEDRNNVLDDMLDNACDVLQNKYEDIAGNLEQHLGSRYSWMVKDVHEFFKRDLTIAKKRSKTIKSMRKQLFINLVNHCRQHPENVGMRPSSQN